MEVFLWVSSASFISTYLGTYLPTYVCPNQQHGAWSVDCH